MHRLPTAAVVAALVLAVLPVLPASAQITIERIAGDNRQQTSAAVAEAAFETSDVAVLVNQDSGLPLAIALGAVGVPTFLVPATGEPDATVLAAIDALEVEQVVAYGEVSQETLDGAARGRPARLDDSPSRAASVAAIARTHPVVAGSDPIPSIYLARSDDLADALAGGSLVDGPIVLLEADGALAPETLALVEELDPARVVALGGPAAVPEDRLAQAAQGRPTDRLAGPSRYATAAAIAQAVFPDGADVVHVVRADIAADAAVAGAFTTGPILLVDNCTGEAVTPVAPATAGAVQAFAPDRVVVVGGTAALCTEVVREAAFGQTVRPEDDSPENLALAFVLGALIGQDTSTVATDDAEQVMRDVGLFGVARGGQASARLFDSEPNGPEQCAFVGDISYECSLSYTVTGTDNDFSNNLRLYVSFPDADCCDDEGNVIIPEGSRLMVVTVDPPAG